MKTLPGIVLSGLLLNACGEAAPPAKTVFDPQVDALKQTRALEAKMQESAEPMRQALEAATGRPADTE